MVEHRRTPSRRPYSLPGWFFALTALACVLGLAGAVWSLTGGSAPTRAAAPAPSVTTSAPPTSAPAQPAEPTPTPPPDIPVEVLNASETPGLAAATAEEAEKAGWKVARVGNWVYGASHEAVYYPEGQEEAAKLLAEDLDIDSVEPAKQGMASSELTVLVLF